MDRYPVEELDEDEDDGTMPANVAELAGTVVGHKIVKAEKVTTKPETYYGYESTATVITLDNGKQVELADTSDCCAYTEVESFLLHVDKIDHVILGVGTTDEYTTWHIFADFGDVMEMKVGWSCGNPFYYGYGFDIRVLDPAPAS